MVRFLNFLTRVRRPRCKPEELLILLPSCMQNSECRQKITNDTAECLRCGRCKVKDMLELQEKYGAQCAVATGGRIALELASRSDVKGIVAVACEKEAEEGMKAVFPKPALAIINIRPHGPCKDTDVDVEEVEAAIRLLLGK
ncbi:MAG: DUF116 domain-containing protein [Planctomycetes bacterium]|nr:DUF116 domain-containing protein [Planctomycetota bacterium]